ncbi:hypothetical protein BDV19DRAFT_32667 [Aspergillus venezuelensis]
MLIDQFRCIKFGYACSNAFLSAPLRQARNVEKRFSEQSAKQHVNTAEDVVSALCESKPSMSDGINDLLDFHQRAFKENDMIGSSGSNDLLPTPESTRSPDIAQAEPKDSPSPNLSMPEAESLLAISRQYERQQYFPFVALPLSITASEMAKSQPFLLLAILTVCSTRNPRLQARTDDRFRRVLSERVILNGEKGLDYLRGLLVYIAWCPLHLRPLKNLDQIAKYMRIAIDMSLNLGLHRDFENRTEEEKHAYLGTCYLSSLVHGQLSARPYDTRTDFGLHFPSQCIEQGPVNNGVHYLRLQELVGQIGRYRADLPDHGRAEWESGPTPQPQERYIVEDKMTEFRKELEDIMPALPDQMHNATPTILTTQYIRLSIAYIPLKPMLQRKSNQNLASPMPPRTTLFKSELLSHANAIFIEIKAFLNTFLSLPSSSYTHFSTREWSQLILTLIISSSLCFCLPSYPHPSAQHADDRIPDMDIWRGFQSDARAQMMKYLESLTGRMRTISVSFAPSNSGSSSKASKETAPDMFSMMDSILEILIKNYNLPTSTGCPASEQRHSSRCPVLNGAIRDTEFWKTLKKLENTPVDVTSEYGGRDTEAPSANSTTGLSIDHLVNHPQDWPSVFGEWVVDLNYLPE